MTVTEIIDKTIDILKAAPTMCNVRDWHKVNGIIPGKYLTISVGCDSEEYEPYTREWDNGTAKLKVYASLENRELSGTDRRKDEDRLEYGERAIQVFAGHVRQILVDNRLLEGAAVGSFPSKIEYVTADEHKDLHIAVISFDVDFYAPRKRREAIIVNEIDALFEGERKIILKGDE